MKGVHLLVAVVAFTTLSSQVHGAVQQRVSGKAVIEKLQAENKIELKCYDCTGCSDSSTHVTDADLKTCKGAVYPAHEMGFEVVNGAIMVPPTACGTHPDPPTCITNYAFEAGIDEADATKKKDAVEAWYKSTKLKQLQDLLLIYGTKPRYYKPVCTITTGLNGVSSRGCSRSFVPGVIRPGQGSSSGSGAGREEHPNVGPCSDFKRTGTSIDITTCYCDANKCNGGSFAKPSVAALAISSIVATLIYACN